MRKYTWLIVLVALALLVGSSLAIAQESKSEAAGPEKSEKKIVIKVPEGMQEMMPGCQMMGQMGQSPSGMMMGQASPMAGCMMGQMQCGMSQVGCCGMGGCGMGGGGMACGGMGRCGAAMGGRGMAMAGNPGMGCGMMGGGMGGAGCGMACGMMGSGMGRHGCAECYLKCAGALKLTEKQIGELKAIRAAAKKAAIRKQADIRVARAELDDIMSEETLDFAKAKAKIAVISDLKVSVQIDRLNSIQKAQRVLTAEQMKQCKAMCKGMGMGTCGTMAGPQMMKNIKIIKDTGEDDEEDVEGEGMEEEESGN
jgi:Spy/CpxP family protein refolding chaperone